MNGMTRAALAAAKEAALSDYAIEVCSLRIASIRTGFDAARERAGIEHVTLHDPRRTAVRFMVKAGVPISKIAQLLGHSNESITYSVYGRLTPDALRDAAGILNFSEIREGRSQVH